MPAMNVEGDKPGSGYDKRADGGRTKKEAINQYNAVGSPEVDEATDEKPGFKKGGEAHKKRRDGGMAEGGADMPRMDHKARGGHAKRASGGKAGGGSPYSSGASLSAPSNDKSGQGKENASAA